MNCARTRPFCNSALVSKSWSTTKILIPPTIVLPLSCPSGPHLLGALHNYERGRHVDKSLVGHRAGVHAQDAELVSGGEHLRLRRRYLNRCRGGLGLRVRLLDLLGEGAAGGSGRKALGETEDLDVLEQRGGQHVALRNVPSLRSGRQIGIRNLVG